MTQPTALHYAPGALRKGLVRFTLTAALIVAIAIFGRWEAGSGLRLLGLGLAAVFAWIGWRNLRLLGEGRMAATIGTDTLTVRSILGTHHLPLEEVVDSLIVTATRRVPTLVIRVRSPRGRRPSLVLAMLAEGPEEVDRWRAALNERVGGPGPFTLEGR